MNDGLVFLARLALEWDPPVGVSVAVILARGADVLRVNLRLPCGCNDDLFLAGGSDPAGLPSALSGAAGSLATRSAPAHVGILTGPSPAIRTDHMGR